MELPKSGDITSKLSIIYRPAIRCLITNIKINNTDNTPWNIWLYQHNHTTNKSVLLYNFSLLAGQVINDDTKYNLISNFSLEAVSNIDTIVYIINGTE